MEYTISDKKKIILEVLKSYNLTENDMNLYFNYKLENSSGIYNDFCNDISYNRIISFFSPVSEYVNIRDIKGLEYKNGTFLDTLLNIYRSESIYPNLGEFDFKKFNDSLKHSNFQLIEKDGKYYVYGDGNHRSLLMLFQYYIEYAKLIKTNPSVAELEAFNKRMQIKVPVIHLDHDYELLSFLRKKNDEEEKYGITETDFLMSATNKKFCTKPLIAYDKKKNCYNMLYKGMQFVKISSKEIVQFIKELDNKNIKNNYWYNKGFFILSNKHIAITDIPVNNIGLIDKNISKYNFPDLSFNYYITSSYNDRSFSLTFAGKDYGSKLEPDLDVIEEFLQKNKDILNYKKVHDPHDSNEPLFTFYNYLNESNFKNLTFDEALKLIDIMSQLDNLITKTKQR